MPRSPAADRGLKTSVTALKKDIVVRREVFVRVGAAIQALGRSSAR